MCSGCRRAWLAAMTIVANPIGAKFQRQLLMVSLRPLCLCVSVSSVFQNNLGTICGMATLRAAAELRLTQRTQRHREHREHREFRGSRNEFSAVALAVFAGRDAGPLL